MRDLKEAERLVGNVEEMVGVSGGGQLGSALRAALQQFKTERQLTSNSSGEAPR